MAQWLRCCATNRKVASSIPAGVRRLLRLWFRIPLVPWTFVCYECCVCCQIEDSATSWSLIQRSPTDCGTSLCVIYKPRKWGDHGPLGAVAPKQTNKQRGDIYERSFVSSGVQCICILKYSRISLTNHQAISPDDRTQHTFSVSYIFCFISTDKICWKQATIHSK